MADEEQKPLGVLGYIVMIFLALIILGVMLGTMLPDSFFNNPI